MKTIIQWIILSFSIYICMAGVPKRSVVRTTPPLDRIIVTRRPVVFIIHENAKIGTHVGRLLGTRCFGNPYYVLMTIDAPFIINGMTGSIYVSGSLDRETTPKYELQVQRYCGNRVDRIRVMIKLKDVNDNAPVFKKSHYQAFVNVNADVGSFILQTVTLHTVFKFDYKKAVTAMDADTGTNGKVKYSIIHQQIPPLFSIDPATGIITVARRLNADFRSRSLTVAATDGGVPSLTGTASVQIHIVVRGS